MRTPLRIAASLFVIATPAFAGQPKPMLCEQLPSGGMYCYPSDHAMQEHADAQPTDREFQRLLKRITTEAPHRHPPRPAYIPPTAYVAPIPAPAREPSVDLPYDAPMHEYLRAALSAVHDQDTATADEALQRAETRLLSRSVPLGATDAPIRGHTDETIRHARQAVVAGDWDGAERLIEKALHRHGDRQHEAMERPIQYP